MSQKFKIGDVVRLKSGGPNMTVEDYDVFDYAGDTKKYLCRWFDEKNKPATLALKEEQLELVHP